MDDREGIIVSNRVVVPGYYILKVRLSKPMEPAQPGQFVMIRIPGNEVFLRRPFGIYHYVGQTLTLMYRVVGKGTERLSKAVKGEVVSVLGPLGKGFHVEKRDRYLVVAGGIGIAGIHSLLEKLKKRATLFFGCNTEDEIAIIEDLMYLNPAVSTIDGSYGFRGNVVDLLGEYLRSIHALPSDPFSRQKGEEHEKESGNIEIFTCGPDAMVKALRGLIEKERIPCQVLVEERMACGMGLCFGCVIETKDETEPYKRVCKEGPVFDLWQIRL